MSFLEALKTRSLLNFIYSMEELNRFFSIPESKMLRHLFIEDFMTRNTFFEWLHDLIEFIRRQMPTFNTSNVDCEIFTLSPELTCGDMDALFASTSKQRTDGISQYITKLDNGHLYIVRTPEGQTGHQLIRLEMYDIHDMKNKEKLSIVEMCKIENTIFDIFPQRS